MIFDCEDFIETLKSLEVIMDNGKQNFINYMKEIDLPNEFQNQNLPLENSFMETSLMKKEELEKYSYLMFLVRLLFRYLISHPSDEILKNENIKDQMI